MESFRLAWADCLLAASQFDAQHECPVVLLVDTWSSEWRKLPLADLERAASGPDRKPAAAGAKSAIAAKLLSWLQRTASDFPLAGAGPTYTSAANSESHNPDSRYEDFGEEVPGEPFAEQLPELDLAAPMRSLYEAYHTLLQHLVQLKFSFELRYAHISFDFGDMARAQHLHPQMGMLVASEAELQEVVEDKARLTELKRAVEARDRFWVDVLGDGPASSSAALGQAVLSGYAILRRLFMRFFRFLHGHAAKGRLGKGGASARPIARRWASNFTLREFQEDYARPGRPVIIAGLNLTSGAPWTLEFFRERCGGAMVPLKRRSARRRSWGRLEPAAELPLGDFIDSFRSNATRRHWYLHDWGLPRGCPAAFGPPPYDDWSVPKFFAGDYFQRVPFERDQHSWPSLFIGSNETESALHIDSGGTNFWLLLLSGRKEWRLFPREELVNTYKDPIQRYFHADAFKPDQTRHPLIQYAESYVGTQLPGDLLFVPGGSPHGVRNLEAIHGVSMNFVDPSNFWLYLWHAITEQRWRTFELYVDEAMTPRGLQSHQEHMTFGQWKSTDWRSLTFDLH